MTYDIDVIRLDVKLHVKTRINLLGACEILN